jgi:hypothetical protein
MTRNYEDWVIDSIVNPWKGKFFSIKDSLQITNLKLLGSSPNIFTDWRWYKNPTFLVNQNSNMIEIQTYSKNCINFRDQRYVVNPIHMDSYKLLSDLLSNFYFETQDYIVNDGKYSKNDFELLINELMLFSKMFDQGTTKSLNSLLQWSKTDDVDLLEDFRQLWGRGQQLCSFKKNK